MADVKTVENDDDVEAFDAVEPSARREDARALLVLMRRATGQPARMWGRSIVGFGRHHYRYPSGDEGSRPASALVRVLAVVRHQGLEPRTR